MGREFTGGKNRIYRGRDLSKSAGFPGWLKEHEKSPQCPKLQRGSTPNHSSQANNDPFV